jgi:VWFA-related protein
MSCRLLLTARRGLSIAICLSWFLCGAAAVMAAPLPAGMAGAGIGASLALTGLCPPADQPPANIKSRPGYEQFQVAASDPAGKPIVHLKQSDFIFPAYLHPQVLYFHEDLSGPPTSVVILIDSSGSMKDKLPNVLASLAAFIDTLNPCDEVAILSFASRGGVRVLTLFTTDHAATTTSLRSIQPYGMTPLYDAIREGLETAGLAHYPNRMLLLITDGEDNASKVTKPELLADAQKAQIPIYAVGIGDPKAPNLPIAIGLGPWTLGGSARWVDANTLDAISHTASGRSFIVPPVSKDNAAGLDSALASISTIAGSGYAIGAIMPHGASAVTITLANHPAAMVHARATLP